MAADKLRLKTVWANDLSELACSVYQSRFGKGVIHAGDINVLANSIPPHDILTGGFPCQPFSAAGKKEGTRDPRGTLFQSIVDVLKTQRPKHFVLENVKRLISMEHGTHFSTVLSALSELNYIVEWRILNARNFGLAQNRERVILLGTRIDLASAHASDVMLALRLANRVDIESGSPGIAQLLANPNEWKSLSKHKAKFPSWGVVLGGRYLASDLKIFSAALPQKALADVLETNPPEEYDFTDQTLGRLHMNEHVDRFVNGVEIVSNQAGGARMGYTIFGIHGIAPTLTASTSRHYERYKVGERFRRLTPREYARLQGFPDDHCDIARGYDQYALYGNAVPPRLVEWVLDRVVNGSGISEAAELSIQPELFNA